MARLSDEIEAFIKEMLGDSRENQLQIVRNELANYFSCAPSQINYVLTTRFTTDKGYYIESRRGGGGYIIIRRMEIKKNESLADEINEKIGDKITYNSAVNIINGLSEAKIISSMESDILRVVLNDRTLSTAMDIRNEIRADILKSVIMVILNRT
ncbi:CtsR family transcriptional regulator [Clostridium thailandense]|uniref:Transcriptional regulator CtsR n=1 Tax=Clostridium thailandense TaxID=2794346 RepID=A0A949TKE7_9CLOT|nr:CtsR family transcriptional regulator [Clostridium thailandense]MBV7274479.1 CtsR family transcriptional regulator [Clostridium thailandense]